MKVEIDQEKCISCGACVSLVPQVFEFNQEGKAEVVETDPEKLADMKEKVEEAANNCPADAIELK